MTDKIIEVNKWLKGNKNFYPFASNFFVKESFIKFIKELEEGGVEQILVTNIYDEEWRIKEEGGEYADTLHIKLPINIKKIKDIFMIIIKYQPDECSFISENILRLWWD